MKVPRASLLVLLAACGSGPDPSKTGGQVASVLVASVASGGFVGSVALDAQNNLYTTASDSVAVLRFDQNVAAHSPWNSPLTPVEVELATSGSSVFWAASGGATAALYTVPVGGFVGTTPAKTAFGAGGDVVGLVADATAAYAALAPAPPGPSPDSWQWPGSTNGNAPATGRIFRIVSGSAGTVQELTSATGISFYPAMMEHVLAQNSVDLFWADSTPVGPEQGRILATTKATWSSAPPRRVGGATLVPDVSVGFVGLAANDTDVAWTVAPAPTPGATGCWVWTSKVTGTPKNLVDAGTGTTPFLCNGLAIDATYAYFAIVTVEIPPDGPDSAYLRGRALARVPLAGGALQTLTLGSDRWYGARRVLVDDTYVYAVDPSYVLRFPKTAFGP
ncbi:MAG TPA: hypothetical protein VIF09_25575 [Polyangiaceae bacterium]